MPGSLSEVQMWKKCTLLWREAHVEVKMAKHPMFGPFFGRSTAPHYTTTTTTRKGQPQQTTNSKQRTTNNQQQTTTNNQQPTTDNRQPTTDNRQPTTDNRQPTTDNRQPTTDNQQPQQQQQQQQQKHQRRPRKTPKILHSAGGKLFGRNPGRSEASPRAFPRPPPVLRVPKLGKKCRFDTFLGRFSAFRNW